MKDLMRDLLVAELNNKYFHNLKQDPKWKQILEHTSLVNQPITLSSFHLSILTGEMHVRVRDSQ